MTDIEITRLCAEAMGLREFRAADAMQFCTVRNSNGQRVAYEPLHDDAQAMGLEDWLIERGRLVFYTGRMIFNPHGYEVTQEQTFKLKDKSSRRRAICECVAKMQLSK